MKDRATVVAEGMDKMECFMISQKGEWQNVTDWYEGPFEEL